MHQINPPIPLSYAKTRQRGISRCGIASAAIALIPLALWYFNDRWIMPYALQLFLAASFICVLLGAFALIRRRRFWWLGLAGLTIGATAVGAYVYFILTFVPYPK